MIFILTSSSKNGEKIGAILISVLKKLSSPFEKLWSKKRRMSSFLLMSILSIS